MGCIFGISKALYKCMLLLLLIVWNVTFHEWICEPQINSSVFDYIWLSQYFHFHWLSPTNVLHHQVSWGVVYQIKVIIWITFFLSKNIINGYCILKIPFREIRSIFYSNKTTLFSIVVLFEDIACISICLFLCHSLPLFLDYFSLFLS